MHAGGQRFDPAWLHQDDAAHAIEWNSEFIYEQSNP